MKVIVFALVFWFFCDFSYGAVFDPYTRRYNIRNASFDALFTPSPIASTSIQAIVAASAKIDNERCKSIHQYAIRPSLDQLVNFQYELIDLCPQLYETIRGKNITTWGPIDEFLQIWYMKFVDALWKRIALKNPSGRCALYDDFIVAAENDLDNALLEYLENNYNPGLCEVNDQTMREWHLFFQRTQIFNRITKFLRIGSFSIQLVHAIAKAYLTEARYNSYLIGPPFPLITYMNASLSMPNFTLTQKSFIKQTYTAMNAAITPLDLAGRQNYLLMKFSEIIDLSWSNFIVFSIIPLDALDGITYYHLILYYSRKQNLISKQLEYVPPPTIPTTSAEPVTCATIPPTTATPNCSTPLGAAAIYIEHGVYFVEDDITPIASPIGTCINSTNGVITYYNGSTPGDLFFLGERVWIGMWLRGSCQNPCVCTSTACYKPNPGNPKVDPNLYLYPHCISPDDCSVFLMIFSGDGIVNPLNSTDMYTDDAQLAAWSKDENNDDFMDVTHPSVPRITRIGCSNCPLPTVPIPSCPTRPGKARIYIENGIILTDDSRYPKADPTGSCDYLPNNVKYYDGSTPANYNESTGPKFVGKWNRSSCAQPCICTGVACFSRYMNGMDKEPVELLLYPHCITPDNCFVTALFFGSGYYTSYSGYAINYNYQSGKSDVTHQAFPRIISIACSACPSSVPYF